MRVDNMNTTLCKLGAKQVFWKNGRWQKFEKRKTVKVLKWVTPWCSQGLMFLHIDTPDPGTASGISDFFSLHRTEVVGQICFEQNHEKNSSSCNIALTNILTITFWQSTFQEKETGNLSFGWCARIRKRRMRWKKSERPPCPVIRRAGVAQWRTEEGIARDRLVYRT